MKKARFGVIGCGSIAEIAHFPSIQRTEGAELVACCDINEETAKQAAEKWGARVWYSDYRTMLAECDDLDAVVIATPNNVHRNQAIAAAKAGVHVVVEKPLAPTNTEAWDIVNACRENGVKLMVGCDRRFWTHNQWAKQLVDEGVIGQVLMARASLHEHWHLYQNNVAKTDFRLRAEVSGGAALSDTGAHAIDLIRHLLGEFEAVQAFTKTYVTERPVASGAQEKGAVTVDDAAWLQVKLENGAIGTIEASRFSTGVLDELRFEICGEKGALRFNLMDANCLYWFDASRKGGAFGGDQGWVRLDTLQHYPGASIPPPRSILGWSRTHAENQYTFLKAILEGKVPQPNIIDGLRTQLILDAAYASAEQGSWIKVEQK